MTRAEEAALTAYPVKVEWVGNQYGGPEDINNLSREKYQQGYEQAEKDLGWISVKDRLPEEHINVFACRNYDGEPYNVSIYKYRRGKWYDQMTDVVYDETVDYWMPMPKIPEK